MIRKTSFHRRQSSKQVRETKTRLRLEALEDRTMLSVDVGATFNGIAYTGYYPPDTIAAAGYDYVVEAVNATLRYYNKAGAQLFSSSLQSFFSPLGGVLNPSDPVVQFDVLTGQFLVGMLDYSGSAISRFDFAVSNDASPFDGWTMARYDMNDHVGGNEFADYPKLGYNADGWFASFNMFLNGSSFHHVDTLGIDKATMTGYRNQVPGGASNFTLAPAANLDANPGDPAWLVEAIGSSGLRIYQIASVDAVPVLMSTVTVPFFSNSPNAQDPGPNPIPTLGVRIMNAQMIYGQLMVCHTVSSGGVARARWYEIDTTQGNPYLYQSGVIDQGSGVYTFFPTVAMNYNGDIGLTFMESSKSSPEFVSIYVTGQSVSDSGTGTVQTPAVTHPGTSQYANINRAGDYSGLTVDPTDGYTFWAANEYKGSSVWNTGIANFGVSPQSREAVAGAAILRSRLAAHFHAVLPAPQVVESQDDSYIANQKPLALAVQSDTTDSLGATVINVAGLSAQTPSGLASDTSLALTAQGLGAPQAALVDGVFSGSASNDASAAPLMTQGITQKLGDFWASFDGESMWLNGTLAW